MIKFLKENKEKIIPVIGVILILVMVIGVTYAIFTYTGLGSKQNSVTSGTITFTYTEASNGISITNAMPISDSSGKVIAQTGSNITPGYFDFTVGATVSGTTSINYEIYGVDTSSSTNKLDPQYVKVYLTDITATEIPVSGYDSTVVPVYSNLDTAVSDSNGKKLYVGSFTSSASRSFS